MLAGAAQHPSHVHPHARVLGCWKRALALLLLGSPAWGSHKALTESLLWVTGVDIVPVGCVGPERGWAPYLLSSCAGPRLGKQEEPVTNLWQRAHELLVNKSGPPVHPPAALSPWPSLNGPAWQGGHCCHSSPQGWLMGTGVGQRDADPQLCPLSGCAQQPGLAWAEVRHDQCSPQTILNGPE